MSNRITLREYVTTGRSEGRDVVLFWSTNSPGLVRSVIRARHDFDESSNKELLDLLGKVQEDGEWSWNREGCPKDGQGKVVVALIALPTVDAFHAVLKRLAPSMEPYLAVKEGE